MEALCKIDDFMIALKTFLIFSKKNNMNKMLICENDRMLYFELLAFLKFNS